jgi:Phytanoyl-CoA dioxygenase (PhyH)
VRRTRRDDSHASGHRVIASKTRRRSPVLTLFENSRNKLACMHQDLSVPVAERVDSLECTGWSEKEGDLFVQPPQKITESLVAVRPHLDPCLAEDGALRVVPGSHRSGRLSLAEVARLRAERGETPVPAEQGSALVMRHLLLHASSKAIVPTRRVLHFVFGPPEPPFGLRWGTV